MFNIFKKSTQPQEQELTAEQLAFKNTIDTLVTQGKSVVALDFISKLNNSTFGPVTMVGGEVCGPGFSTNDTITITNDQGMQITSKIFVSLIGGQEVETVISGEATFLLEEHVYDQIQLYNLMLK